MGDLQVLVYVDDPLGEMNPGKEAPFASRLRTLVEDYRPHTVGWAESWPQVKASLADAECLLVGASRVEDLVGCLQSIEGPPVVVVTEDPEQAALRLRRVSIDEFAGMDPAKIEDSIRSAVRSYPLGRAAHLVEQHPGLSPPVREWMLEALTRRPPFRTVKDSAEALGTTSSTIQRHWRRSIRDSSPKKWLSWIQLMRAHHLKTRENHWTSVAGSLGITFRTLQRLSERLIVESRILCRSGRGGLT